jgi:thiamine pyrophosphate-dependent acetolactate synthase large subunit-like protein
VLERPEGLKLIAERYADQPVVLTLGGTIREMIAVAGRRPNHLPILDAMGQPAAIGLGLALGLEGHRFRKTVVVEGDGSLLMGLSSIATAGHLRPRGLLLVVFDNGVYLATGGQPTAAADADYAAIALACGWDAARDIESDLSSLEEAFEWAEDFQGPVLLRIKVGTEQPQTDFFLEDPVVLARQFTDWLHSAPA